MLAGDETRQDRTGQDRTVCRSPGMSCSSLNLDTAPFHLVQYLMDILL